MNKLFLRIYAQMLLFTIAVCIISLMVFNQISEYRELQYTKNQLSGIKALISQGLNRHSGEKQNTWLSLSSKLTGLDLNLIPHNSDQETYYKVENLTNIFKKVEFSINETQAVEFKYEGLNRQLIQGMIYLVSNSLGQTPAAIRTKQLEQIQSAFNTNVELLDPRFINLTDIEIASLDSKLTIYRFNQTLGTSALTKFISEDTEYILQIGPIAPFNQFPLIGIFLLVVLILVSSLLTGWLLFKPFAFRLKKLAFDVNQVATLDDTGNTSLEISIKQPGDDALSTLTKEIDQMANRVISLVKEQQQMSRSISHEFRTPLVKMAYRIAMLNESNQLSDNHSTTLRSYIDDLHTLVDELLLFSSLEVNAHPEKNTFNLKKLITKLQNDLQPLSESIISNNCPENLKIHAIEGYWQKILQNLITNAQRYAKTSITISTNIENNCLVTKISDDGTGIKEENIDQIFEPFFVEELSRNKKMAGHGLGLSIVKRMVQAQHGVISVNNRASGGAEFSINFPLQHTIKE